MYGVNLILGPIRKDISNIKENLSNHITATNKKIDDLKTGQKELDNKLNKLLEKK